MANPSVNDDKKHLLIERTLPAPRSLVYQAFTDPQRMAQWLGPHGFVATSINGDVRAGGAWRSGMRGPDGTEHIASGVYREVVPNVRLVFTYAWEEGGVRGHESVCRVELSDLGAQTRMVFSQGPFETQSSAEGHQGGWSEAFEKLAQAVAQ